MDTRSIFLVGVCYVSLAVGVLMGLLGVWTLVRALLWPMAPIGAYAPSLIVTFGSSLLALSVGLMIQYTLKNPHTYGARDTVRNKWKQW
jgi:hypothetical protein